MCVLELMLFAITDLVCALRYACTLSQGLGASVWTNNVHLAEYIAGTIESGTVWIGAHNILLPYAPFGGYKQSGYGRDQGPDSLKEYTQVKSIITRVTKPSEVPNIEHLTVSGGRAKATEEQQEMKRDERMGM